MLICLGIIFLISVFGEWGIVIALILVVTAISCRKDDRR